MNLYYIQFILTTDVTSMVNNNTFLLVYIDIDEAMGTDRINNIVFYFL